MKCPFPIFVWDRFGVLQAVPCGRCRVCRINRARQWSIRVRHEALFFENRCSFLTLTYDDEHLPQGSVLVKKDLQDFMKRFRKEVGSTKLRYYAVGEYGKENLRPHFHLIIFGVPLGSSVYREREVAYSRKTHKRNGFHVKIYSWDKGLVHVGEVTDQSSFYVTGYVMKKIAGRIKDFYSSRGLTPEFAVMSRRPGLGLQYIAQPEIARYFKHNPYVTMGNCKYPLPRIYADFLHIKRKFKDKADYISRLAHPSPEQADQIEKNIEKKFHLLGKDERL